MYFKIVDQQITELFNNYFKLFLYYTFGNVIDYIIIIKLYYILVDYIHNQ